MFIYFPRFWKISVVISLNRFSLTLKINLRTREQPLRELAGAWDLCGSRLKSDSSEGVDVNQRPLQDQAQAREWAQARELCGSGPRSRTSMETGLNQ